MTVQCPKCGKFTLVYPESSAGECNCEKCGAKLIVRLAVTLAENE